MRILYVSERPPYPFFLGGAARCAHRLLLSLTGDLGVECMAVGSGDYAVSPWSFPDVAEYQTLGIKGSSAEQSLDGLHEPIVHRGLDCGYPALLLSNFKSAFAEFIDTFKPDLIWSQLEGAAEILALARAKGIPAVFYLHDAEFDPAELRAIAKMGCQLICSSGFLAAKASTVIGRKAQVVYPAAELYFDTQGDPHGYVTMINPHQVKGVDTFFEIAKRLPQEKFLLLESWKLSDSDMAALQARLMQHPNVHFERRVADMRSIYRQTKLLLVPSIWAEGFGMVAIEAQSCGIPVIASARGGLPEAVGEGGMLIEDYRNPALWIQAIGKVLNDPSAYAEWSRRALRHASGEQFVPSQLARRLLAACSAPAPRSIFVARLWTASCSHLRQLPVVGRLLHRIKR